MDIPGHIPILNFSKYYSSHLWWGMGAIIGNKGRKQSIIAIIALHVILKRITLYQGEQFLQPG